MFILGMLEREREVFYIYVYICVYISKIIRPVLMARMLKSVSVHPFYATEKLTSDCYQLPHA